MNIKVTLKVNTDSYYSDVNTDLALEKSESSEEIKLTLSSSDSERFIYVDRKELQKALKLLCEE